jgi:hypothetical protein
MSSAQTIPLEVSLAEIAGTVPRLLVDAARMGVRRGRNRAACDGELFEVIGDRGGIDVPVPIGRRAKNPSNDLDGIKDIHFLQVLAQNGVELPHVGLIEQEDLARLLAG